MPVSYLNKINKVVLAAGHGGTDPGAVNGQFQEAQETIFLTDIVAKNLRDKGLSVDVVPHSLDLAGAIDWVNAHYSEYDENRNDNVWVIELHRDMNAPNLPQEQKDNQMGIYFYQGDDGSQQIADTLLDKYFQLGAFKGSENRQDFNGSWARNHYLEWAGYHLGWINNTKPVAHLIEHGYMSGRNDIEHLTKLANWTSQAIYEALTDKPYNVPKPPTVISSSITNTQYMINEQELAATRELIKANSDKINAGDYNYWLDSKNYVTPTRLQLGSELKAIETNREIESLKNEINIFKTNTQQPFWEFLKSKKLLALITSLISILVAKFVPEAKDTTDQILQLAVTYILGQSAVDVTVGVFKNINANGSTTQQPR